MPREIWGIIFMGVLAYLSFKYDPFWKKLSKLEDKIEEMIDED